MVRLLECTGIRVGSDEYARENRSFGLTTLRDHHVEISGSSLRFEFRGKSSKIHRVSLSDRRLARIVQRCQALPGEELFQYLDDEGSRQSVGSGDVNEYLREISGQEFTTKDFRTWAGTIIHPAVFDTYLAGTMAGTPPSASSLPGCFILEVNGSSNLCVTPISFRRLLSSI